MSEYKALYRKWRPFDFDDVCGQDTVTDVLKYEVANNKISHAYLFCGSRGTGKTSCAKILAKAVNCENPRGGNPCNECESCRSIDMGIATDVIEMDAASNNGVDDVRTLKDEIAFNPAFLKYRVYIIDEVHMMSSSAFNALLKTLEEPPPYVVFILATTEFHKLPTTIVSRCQRFDFRRISSEIIMNRLKKIADTEGIELTSDGARLIARSARGGMRDAVSLLDLCAGSKSLVDAKLVSETIGTGDRHGAYKLISAIGKSDYNSVYSILREVVMGSGDVTVFWGELIDSYRDLMVLKTTDSAKSYLDLTDAEFESLKAIASDFTMAKLYYHAEVLEKALSDMQLVVNSKQSVAEIALTKMCTPSLSSSAEALETRIEELEKKISVLKYSQGTKLEKNDGEIEITKENTEQKRDTDIKEPAALNESNVGEYKPYGKVEALVSKITEIKPSLGVKLAGGEIGFADNYRFNIALSDFFLKALSRDEESCRLIMGVIAELEEVDASLIKIYFSRLSTKSTDKPMPNF
jgi:DNA polymerase-3 subunit gamma/tau